MQTINVGQARQKLAEGAVLVDIRGADEYARERIETARSVPMLQLQAGGLPTEAQNAPCVIFYCKSGMRTQGNAALLAKSASQCREAYLLEGGLDAWKQAGLGVLADKSQPLELMRQVQIAAGLLVLLGVICGTWVAPVFYALAAFVGIGLLFAGISGFCGMARLLMLMPWNKRLACKGSGFD